MPTLEAVAVLALPMVVLVVEELDRLQQQILEVVAVALTAQLLADQA
jgi:putative effector of murein hydrolase LrgA (UPF0299 family)